MRPPRLIIAAMFLFTSILVFIVFLFSSNSSYVTPNSSVPFRVDIQKFFTIGATFSLFPPSALITLTHDNTTSFIASLASFGPALTKDGLRGQIWIGSGLGDDTVDGELGCSDVLGWKNLAKKFNTVTSTIDHFNFDDTASIINEIPTQSQAQGSHETIKDYVMRLKNQSDKSKSVESSARDGTDDYLFEIISDSKPAKYFDKSHINQNDNYANIRTIQEEAEIAGKVVLLSRGGCGFLEKLRWAQRRGAIGLIVGDNTKGGPLIQMFAKGDTSSANIPSVFTSYTTAHLLCSLASSTKTPSNLDGENGKSISSIKSDTVGAENKKIKSHHNHIHSSEVSHVDKVTSQEKDSDPKYIQEFRDKVTGTATWLISIFSSPNNQNPKLVSSRPPSSGQLDWSVSDDSNTGTQTKSSTQKYPGPRKTTELKSKALGQSDDNFMIGVQDWRDPDLIGAENGENLGSEADLVLKTGHKKQSLGPKNDVLEIKNSRPGGGRVVQENSKDIPLTGGIITPGSGEYTVQKEENNKKDMTEISESYIKGSSSTILKDASGTNRRRTEITSTNLNPSGDKYSAQGLWVTLTPVSGSNPFLDTLLVLVVSPLATLTIVYALLLVRSRIKRRRWRAPRSVIERLPVRTYQSIATSAEYSPRLPSSPNVSVTTPLLLNTHIHNVSSRMNTDSDQLNTLLEISNQLQNSTVASREPEHEKGVNHMSQWKKHSGNQIECVVCLEEYIDGVSRVMGLPCGHEFHAECITPWLTTRRRTCPICKGDVVRSMSNVYSPAPRRESYPDNSDPEHVR